MTIIENDTFDQERALYALHDATVKNCRFDGPADGESAFKEAGNLKVDETYFNLRYPFWHVDTAEISNCFMTENCRAALWYDKNIIIEHTHLGGIKALRECENITLKNCVVESPEFIWRCKGITIDSVNIEQSEYPFFEVKDSRITKLKMKGKYSFQYNENVEITDSELDTKDAFWHTKNVTVRDSIIKSEYLGWYSENLKLVNCKIIGTQPFCYCKNLVLENCTMEGCDLSFERSTVTATIKGKIDSVKNPLGGKIKADEIGEIIMERELLESLEGFKETEITAGVYMSSKHYPYFNIF